MWRTWCCCIKDDNEPINHCASEEYYSSTCLTLDADNSPKNVENKEREKATQYVHVENRGNVTQDNATKHIDVTHNSELNRRNKDNDASRQFDNDSDTFMKETRRNRIDNIPQKDNTTEEQLERPASSSGHDNDESYNNNALKLFIVDKKKVKSDTYERYHTIFKTYDTNKLVVAPTITTKDIEYYKNNCCNNDSKFFMNNNTLEDICYQNNIIDVNVKRINDFLTSPDDYAEYSIEDIKNKIDSVKNRDEAKKNESSDAKVKDINASNNSILMKNQLPNTNNGKKKKRKRRKRDMSENHVNITQGSNVPKNFVVYNSQLNKKK